MTAAAASRSAKGGCFSVRGAVLGEIETRDAGPFGRRQRDYAIANPKGWVGYGPDIWGLTACDGPGQITGTNSLGTINGGAGSTYETDGGLGGTFAIGATAQGSASEVVRDSSSGWAITYFANATGSAPVSCSVIGYAVPL